MGALDFVFVIVALVTFCDFSIEYTVDVGVVTLVVTRVESPSLVHVHLWVGKSFAVDKSFVGNKSFTESFAGNNFL